MLQRAASNAYSWWWASHIRTRQSKWLDQSLQDMEEKVKDTLKILDEDADSFAKRAEMYYRKRPELINFVEETYRAYRALAERYDKISGELQNANNTLANVFPGEVQFGMEEEDSETQQKKVTPPDVAFSKAPKNLPDIPRLNVKFSKKEKKPKLPPERQSSRKTPISNLSKEEAVEEIDKMQKGILVLQTEKEYVKSSYERALGKYWGIEKQITEMQEKVCNLQNEFNVEAVIEDDEARALMAASALKSCEATLAQLQEQQKRSAQEARIETERVKSAEEKLRSLKGESLPNPEKDETFDEAIVYSSSATNLEEDVDSLKYERLELDLICKKVKEYFEVTSSTSFSVTEMAEKIDELVNKVLKLETAVSSQNALINRLRSETDEVQKHLQTLEEDKVTLADDSNSLTKKIKEMEEELNGIQDLSLSVKDRNSQIRTHFTETFRNFGDLSEKLQTPKQSDGIDMASSFEVDQSQETTTNLDTELNEACKEEESKVIIADHSSRGEDMKVEPEKEVVGARSEGEKNGSYNLDPSVKENHVLLGKPCVEVGQQEATHEKETETENLAKAEESDSIARNKSTLESDIHEDSLWQQLFLSGLDNREKILLTEYTSILRHYKDMKRRLSEVEKKNQQTMFETMAQVREIKSSNTMKDLEIRSLRQKLNVLQVIPDENSDKEIRKSRVETKPDGTKSLVSDSSIDHSDQSTSKSQNRNPVEGTEVSSDPLSAEEEIEMVQVEEPNAPSSVEEKFRRDIDEVLEENLEFWLRFSTSFHEIQKFQTALQELKVEFYKLKESKKRASSSTSTSGTMDKVEVAPLEEKLRELHPKLSHWLDQNALLKDELQLRLASLGKIKEEISGVLKMASENEQVEFTSYQAAKFQGEVLDIQQENSKVAEELQAGLDHVRGLQSEVEKAISKLSGKLEGSGSRNSHNNFLNVRHSMSRTKIPLRSFLFGVKPKKSKPSMFSCMNPALQKQYSDMHAAGNIPM